MPRGAALGNDVKNLIAGIYLTDKNQVAKEVLQKVHAKLGRDDWPKLSVIQREIKLIEDNRAKMLDAGGLDFENPWHLGIMRKHNIDAAAVPCILGVQMWAKKHSRDKVTVSQARWIARLYAYISPGVKPKVLNEALGWMYNWSRVYMLNEMACDLMNMDLDTSQLDELLPETVKFGFIGNTYFIEVKVGGKFFGTADKDLIKQIKEANNNERTHNTTK